MTLGLALLTLAACNGRAVVTMTATPSSDTFLVYRVALTSVQLKESGGKTLTLLPQATTVDFTNLLNLTEVLGAPVLAKGTYTSAVITLDYSAAQIVYDDGSPDGVALSPVNAGGQAVGQVTTTVTLDPSAPYRSAERQAGQLALGFNLAASNVVNLSAKTVTITPMVQGSTLPIDAKLVRIRGPLQGVNSTSFSTGVIPFDSTIAGAGQLTIVPSSTTTAPTTYEINGFVSNGAAGQTQLAALPANTLTVAYGTLNSTSSVSSATTTTTPTATTPAEPATTTTTTSSISFSALQVQVDGSTQTLSHVAGVVSVRAGNSLGLEDATLTQTNGTVAFVPGTTVVNVGANTLVTFFGQGVPEALSAQQISVGSVIDAFGIASTTSAGGVLLDASAGRVRLDLTTASGLVTAQGAEVLSLNLASLAGRAVGPFNFLGSGANPDQYVVSTGSLDLSNAVASAPVVVTGLPSAFGTANPDFAAVTLLDPTTIEAELVVDWPAGTAAPFTTFDSSSIDLDITNSSIGGRHQIQVGAQIIDVVGLSSDPLITPNTSSTATVYSIGHAASMSIESFNTYQAFITQLQTELNGALATGITAVGQYDASTFAFSATSITLFLNN